MRKTALGASKCGAETDQVLRRQGGGRTGFGARKPTLSSPTELRAQLPLACLVFARVRAGGCECYDCRLFGPLRNNVQILSTGWRKFENRGNLAHTLACLGPDVKQQVKLVCRLFGEDNMPERIMELEHLRKAQGGKPELFTGSSIDVK